MKQFILILVLYASLSGFSQDSLKYTSFKFNVFNKSQNKLFEKEDFRTGKIKLFSVDKGATLAYLENENRFVFHGSINHNEVETAFDFYLVHNDSSFYLDIAIMDNYCYSIDTIGFTSKEVFLICWPTPNSSEYYPVPNNFCIPVKEFKIISNSEMIERLKRQFIYSSIQISLLE